MDRQAKAFDPEGTPQYDLELLERNMKEQKARIDALSVGPVESMHILCDQFNEWGQSNAETDWIFDAEYRDDGYGTVHTIESVMEEYGHLIEQECRECRVTDSHDIHTLTEWFINGYMAEWTRLGGA